MRPDLTFILIESSEVNFTQSGIDFYKKGIVSMQGSEARYILAPAYEYARNSVIVS